jgi:hypothetical protein
MVFCTRVNAGGFCISFIVSASIMSRHIQAFMLERHGSSPRHLKFPCLRNVSASCTTRSKQTGQINEISAKQINGL